MLAVPSLAVSLGSVHACRTARSYLVFTERDDEGEKFLNLVHPQHHSERALSRSHQKKCESLKRSVPQK